MDAAFSLESAYFASTVLLVEAALPVDALEPLSLPGVSVLSTVASSPVVPDRSAVVFGGRFTDFVVFKAFSPSASSPSTLADFSAPTRAPSALASLPPVAVFSATVSVLVVDGRLNVGRHLSRLVQPDKGRNRQRQQDDLKGRRGRITHRNRHAINVVIRKSQQRQQRCAIDRRRCRGRPQCRREGIERTCGEVDRRGRYRTCRGGCIAVPPGTAMQAADSRASTGLPTEMFIALVSAGRNGTTLILPTRVRKVFTHGNNFT